MANVRLDGYSLRIVDLVNILTEISIKVEISHEAIKSIEKSSEIIKSTTKLPVNSKFLANIYFENFNFQKQKKAKLQFMD